jgi:hypothetical protein
MILRNAMQEHLSISAKEISIGEGEWLAENVADGVGSFDNVQFEVNSAVFSSKMIRQDYREFLVNGEFVVYMIKKQQE